MDQFVIKRGSTSPSLRYALLPDTIILVGAEVRFQMMSRDGQTVIDAPATIVTEDPPVVQYDWQAGDTATAGLFNAEFKVTNADNTIEQFPTPGFIPVLVSNDVPDMGG